MNIKWTNREIYHLILLIIIIGAFPVGVLTILQLPLNLLTAIGVYLTLGVTDYILDRWVLEDDK